MKSECKQLLGGFLTSLLGPKHHLSPPKGQGLRYLKKTEAVGEQHNVCPG